MKLRIINRFNPARTTRLAGLVIALLMAAGQNQLHAQRVIRSSGGMPPGFSMPMSSPPPDSSSSSKSDSASSGPSGPYMPSEALKSAGGKTNDADGIQLSFQGANIDMIVQWLSQTTGKTVLKHPQVQCQLTITSSKKVSPREAINLVYRALALEGFTAVELSSSIMIVPEGKEPMMSPELLDGSQTNIPDGRQRLVKVFALKNIHAVDLKDRLKPALSDKATVDIDEVANQLIITDYNDNIRGVGILIKTLDTAKPEDVSVRVIPLKNVAASDLMKEIQPLYQKKSGKSLKDTVEINADAQANVLLVLSSESNFHAIEDFVSQLDTKDAQDKIMQTFSLKNADAQDVAKQLQDLNSDQSVTTRYFYNFGGSSDNKNAKKMTVVADRRRNAIIVQAPPSQMESISKMVDELDQAVNDDSLAPKIYPLKFISAADLEDVLNELFLKKTQQRSYWDFFDDSGPSSTPDRDVGRLYGKVRITSEPYSNALIVTSNSKENLAAVEAIIKQLDQPSEAGESTLHCELKFAKAATVANSINILFAKNGSPPLRGGSAQPNQQNNANNGRSTQQSSDQDASTSTQPGFDLPQATKEDGYFPWLGGQPDSASRTSDGKSSTRPVSDLVGRVRAVADERSNALLISANVHFFPQIMKLIDDLDAPTDQVLIEARLVEVSTDLLDKMGVRWGPTGKTSFTADDYDNAILGTGSSTYQQGYGGKTLVNGAAATAASTLSPATLLASMRSGVVDSTISLDFLVQFLKKTTETTVLAEPQINIRDNETGRLFVGQEVPIPDNSLNSSVGSSTTTFRYKNVGIVLEVTPHINTSGDVELKVHAESSSLVPGLVVNNGSVFDTRNFRTDLTAKNGQTLVLGGIIQKQISDTLRKTPVLGDIPGLKWIFNKKDKSSQDVELMVFLRPHVVKSPEDAQAVLHDAENRAPLVKQWQDSAPKSQK